MYIVKLDIKDIVYFLAEELERLLPFGYSFNEDSAWELVDNCFLCYRLQNYKDTDLYEAYSQLLPTEVIDSIFSKLSNGINRLLDVRIDPRLRTNIPDSVYYEGAGKYKLYWRSIW